MEQGRHSPPQGHRVDPERERRRLRREESTTGSSASERADADRGQRHPSSGGGPTLHGFPCTDCGGKEAPPDPVLVSGRAQIEASGAPPLAVVQPSTGSPAPPLRYSEGAKSRRWGQSTERGQGHRAAEEGIKGQRWIRHRSTGRQELRAVMDAICGDTMGGWSREGAPLR
jgi:hypothetical protein